MTVGTPSQLGGVRVLLPTAVFGCAIAWVAGGCVPSFFSDPAPGRDLDALMDPVTCQGCHPKHYREWSGSMHAYAGKDPIFRAMNARGQRETDGALGDFCVNCHMPVAVRMGLTEDGLNLDEVPESLQGVTCIFCHSVTEVEGDHNNPLKTSFDGIMRGGIDNALEPPAHGVAYSPLHDRTQLESSALCGSCHDIVTPNDVFLERTFDEWKHTLYSNPDSYGALSCSACHMRGRTDKVANYDGAPDRRRHEHLFAGVDIALTQFPQQAAQREAVQNELDSSLLAQLCVDFDGAAMEISVTLENVAAGHNWPSGAAQDRRVWVEVEAVSNDNVVFSSGVVEEGEPMVEGLGSEAWRLGDRMFDAAGEEVHMFWQAQEVRSELLPGPTAFSPEAPDYTNTHVTHRYTYAGVFPDEVRVQVNVRPMGLDVVDELIESGDLDAGIRDKIPTFTLSATELTWRLEDGLRCVPESLRGFPTP